MRNLYDFFYLLWHLDISTWQVNDACNTHTVAEKERETK